MSPVQKRMVTERNPAQFAPSMKEVFWRALLTEEDSTKRDKREEETLDIARSALTNSRWANKIAISAIVLSIATAIIVAIIQFISQKP